MISTAESRARNAAMMNDRLPIVPSAFLAYSDLRRAVSALRVLMICALFIYAADKVAEDHFPKAGWDNPLTAALFGFILSSIESFCLTPVLIAVHRFFVLGEVEDSYAIDLSEPRFLRFFVCLVVLSLAGAAVFWIQEALSALGVSPLVTIVPFLAAIIVLVIAAIRLAILFPAVAVTAGNANVSNALADTKGHAFRIFMVFALALLPCIAIVLGITILLGPSAHIVGSPRAMFEIVFAAVVQLVIMVLCISIASQVFRAYARNVGQPA
jgi:hypothetical protein